VQRLLAAVDIDWEEQAARLIGDVAAHELGRLLRAADAWGRQAADILGRDLAEYLQEEGRVLAPAAARRARRLPAAVDVLRDDVDRLTQRVARLTDLAD
jgi:ubiquinone biosynthesis accessory factor UbiJ